MNTYANEEYVVSVEINSSIETISAYLLILESNESFLCKSFTVDGNSLWFECFDGWCMRVYNRSFQYKEIKLHKVTPK